MEHLNPVWPAAGCAQMKAALLQQPEVYELEVNEQTYRRERDADKPYEQLRRERLAQVGKRDL